MNIVFVGPTVGLEEARRVLDARFLGPARQGDVYRACQAAPNAIGLIDGYFDGVPAVWHKEILHAMEQGIHVFGASSMGALRAVELERFGMTGVGEIFEWFRRGELEDDDEVAVRHGPAEDGFRPLSVPMVNIRATIGAAERARIVGGDTAQALIAAAKSLPYGERSYRAAIARVAGKVPQSELDAFSNWWTNGQVDQKRHDALSMLGRMARLGSTPAKKMVAFRVEETEAWREARDRVRRTPGLGAEMTEHDAAVLEEVRVLGSYPVARERAFTRALILENAETCGSRPDGDEILDAVKIFRGKQNLITDDEFDRWRIQQGLTNEAEFERFFSEQSDVLRADLVFRRRTTEALADQLRADSMYGRFMTRADLKRRTLEGHPTESASQVPTPSDDELWNWYFRYVLEVERPPDLAWCARTFGFDDLPAFWAAVEREWKFRSKVGAEKPPISESLEDAT